MWLQGIQRNLQSAGFRGLRVTNGMADDETPVRATESEPAQTAPASRQGRMAGHARMVRDVWEQPSRIGGFMRNAFVSLWLTKGGGFYGLGYVLVFVALEFRSLTGDIGGSNSVAGFMASQAVQYIVRLSFESFLNALLALVWPWHVFQWLGIFGLILLGAAWFAYVSVARPIVETWFPEIGEARAVRAKARKAKRKGGE